MTSAFTNAIARGFRSLFAPTVTVTHTETRPMTAADREAFDAAFAAIDKAFQKLERGGA